MITVYSGSDILRVCRHMNDFKIMLLNGICFVYSRGNVEDILKDFQETQGKFNKILQNRRNISKYNKVRKSKERNGEL